MPHHWRPIKEGKGGEARLTEVETAVSDAGGTLLFAGAEEGHGPEKWFALVDVSGVDDPDAMWRSIGTNGSTQKFR